MVQNLATQLTKEYGSGFDFSSLYKYMRFYQCFPNILDAASPKSFLLSWTHYRTLLQVEDEVARKWYENEAAKETWSAKTLQRNISSQYYYRMETAKLDILPPLYELANDMYVYYYNIANGIDVRTDEEEQEFFDRYYLIFTEA